MKVLHLGSSRRTNCFPPRRKLRNFNSFVLWERESSFSKTRKLPSRLIIRPFLIYTPALARALVFLKSHKDFSGLSPEGIFAPRAHRKQAQRSGSGPEIEFIHRVIGSTPFSCAASLSSSSCRSVVTVLTLSIFRREKIRSTRDFATWSS